VSFVKVGAMKWLELSRTQNPDGTVTICERRFNPATDEHEYKTYTVTLVLKPLALVR